MSGRTLDQGRDLRRNMAHRGGHYNLNGSLHGDRKLGVHLPRDVLDGGLRNVDKGLLHDWVFSEDAEVGFRDDLEFHPRNFAEHDGELLIELDDDEDTIFVAEADAEIEMSGAAWFV